MVGDQTLEPGNDLRVPAELQVCLDLLFDHRQSELFEPHRLCGREFLVAKVAQGLTAEVGECLPELLRPSRRTVRSRDGDDLLEAPAVQLVLVRQKQPIARRSCLDPLGSEPLAQRRDVTLKGCLSSLRRVPPPQPVHQLVDSDDLALAQQQQSEQRTLLRSNRREVDAVCFHLEPAEKPELHLVTIVTRETAR